MKQDFRKIALPLAHPRVAKKIAARHRAWIIQGVESGFDFISSIKYADKNEFKIETMPELYFKVRESRSRYFLTYAIYHRYDPKARHHHDLEGVVYAIRKDHSWDDTGSVDVSYAAVNHMNLKFGRLRSPGVIEIEAGGHGLTVTDEHSMSKFPIVSWGAPTLIYEDFILVNMGTKQFGRQQERLRKMFNPSAKFPDQWFDRLLENYVKKRKPMIWGKKIRTTVGLFDYRPDILFELAAIRGKI